MLSLGIALQRLEIDDQWRLEAVAFANLVDVVDDRVAETAATRENPDVLGHELEHVEIAGEDDDVESRGFCLLRQRADDIIGFECRDLDDRNAERFHDLTRPRKLGAELLRRARPLRFVFGELLVPEGRSRGIECGDGIRRGCVVECLEEHRREAIRGVGHLAPAVAQRGHRVEGAVHQVVPIHQQQSLASHSDPW